MSIELLPDEIINQIAAGEVIENPSSVIKELVENSIDANSTLIEVELIHSGFKSIIIKDNGVGISNNDLLKAPLRHATSKIKSFDDLYSINTMGFRGEALASIFSISKAKIISKEKNSKYSYEISSDNIKEVKISGGDLGTKIIVEDIFYNTPARKKYLKSENIELKNIVGILTKYSIYYNKIKFILKNNGKIIINKPQFEKKIDNISYILGNELKNNIIEIKSKLNGMTISGFIGNPSIISYAVKKNQFIFVNGRYVKSKLINDAIYEGFSTNLMEARHPFFICFLDIDPEIIDVNIHPKKIEIKFENELEIFEFIQNSIKNIFIENTIFKPFETKKTEKDLELNKHINLENIKKEINLKNEKTYFNKEFQNSLVDEINLVKEEKFEYKHNNFNTDKNNNPNIITNNFNNSDVDIKDSQNSNIDINTNNYNKDNSSYGPLYDILKEYRIIGQINKTFIIIETKTEMIIIDQHVAEEKFFYETFKEQLKNKNIKTQILLKPELLKLSNVEFLLYKENIDLIEKIGFKTEEFGTNEILVREVPININKQTILATSILDILYEISIDKKFKLLEEEKLNKLASISCKKSIKAGHELTNNEIHSMIENLKKLK